MTYSIGTDYIPSVSSLNFPKIGDILSINILRQGKDGESDVETEYFHRFRDIVAQVTSVVKVS